MSISAPSDLASRRPWMGLVVLLLPTLVLAMDISVLFLATPHLVEQLTPTAPQLLWITDIYGFLIAGFLVTMGTVGDRIGRRRMLLYGAVGFAGASLIAAFATSVPMLITARACLGVFGATLMPSTLGLISTLFGSARQRSVAIGAWVTTMSVGITVGPLIGGVMLEHFWWGSVFLPGAVVMLAVVAAAPRLLPESERSGTGLPDVLSAVLSLATILSLVHVLKEAPVDGWTLGTTATTLCGLVSGALFVRRQRRLTEPFIDLQVFRNRAFSAALVLLLFGTLAINGIEYVYPQHLQLVRGLSPFEAGLWTVPGALGVVLGSMAAPMLARRFPAGSVVGAGAGLAALGFGIMATVGTATTLTAVVAGLVVAQIGIAPIIVLGTDLVVGSVPAGRAGSASSISETSGELGVALGIATLGTVVTSIYARRLPAEIVAGLPDGMAAPAEESLSGALRVADRLAGERGHALALAAMDAFSDGFAVAATVSTVIAGVLAVLGFTVLRRTHSGT
ncbi:MFS transporter [Phytoactinopolyspora halotolerans]|uniref:MFS transporter n=1 Tax=Phytoactinopolyspora halotolerans TaxID=1981512 RepID=A0A6L9S7T4_9ACTN|nr:MFS transporter [Phytoactinopolyspora halotolerans]NEE01525.1 MFS transporter [Phytoactinopolyspora halotolerans]